MRVRREKWIKRVEQWRRSGVTAKQFAASIGVKPANLTQWAWRLGREQRARRASSVVAPAAQYGALVELVPGTTHDDRFEVVVRSGRQLRIPASFDAPALQRLLAVLEVEQ